MSNLIKVIQSELIALQTILAGADPVKSAVIDVSTKFAAAIFWDWAAIDTAASAAATELSIQGSQKASGNDTWVPSIQNWLSVTADAVQLSQTALGGSGTNTITVASGSIGAQSYFFINDPVPTNSEWAKRVKQVGATITAEDNFLNSHASALLFDRADRFKFDIDLTNITRLRVVIGNNRGSTNRNIMSRVALITTDSIA